MDEILELQRLLAQVQETPMVQRLSDRIIIEIVETITKTFGMKLIYTSDGKEYMTPENLEKEIMDIILSKGRININELPKILNVGIENISDRIQNMLKKGMNLIYLDGNIFTNTYLDMISEEINEDLEQRHKIQISELVLKYNFPLDYMLYILNTRLNTIIQGIIQNNISLITITYSKTIMSQLRGILRGTFRPLNISQICKDYDYEEGIVKNIIEELIKNDDVDGKLANGIFISNKFLQNQEIIIKNFFKQNDYIEYDFLQKNLYIQKPKEILKNLFKDDCIFLQYCCYNKQALNKIKEHIIQILNTDGNIDVKFLLPSILNENDIEALITNHMQLIDFEISGSLIISNRFLDTCASKFRDKIVNLIYKNPSKWVEKVETEKEKEPVKKGSKKGGKKKDIEEVKKDLFDQDEVIKHLKDTKVIGDEYDPDFEERLYNQLRERLNKMYESIKVELFESKKSLTTDIIQELQGKLEERIIQIQMMAKSISNIESKYTNIDINYLNEKLYGMLKPVLENLLLLFCRKYALHLPPTVFHKNQEEDVKENDPKKNSSLNDKPLFRNNDAIIAVIDMLPKDLNKLMKELLDSLNNKKTMDFINSLQKNGNYYGLKIMINEKKIEKNFFMAQKYFAKEIVQSPKADEKLIFFNLLNYLMFDQGLYFALKFEDQSVGILATMLLQEAGISQEIQNDIQQGLALYSEAGSEPGVIDKLVEINKRLSKMMK